MNSFLQALDAGYSEEEVLKYITKSIPQLVPKINKALSKGYGVQQILGFLSKSSPQDTKGMSESQIHRRNKDLDSELAKKGLTVAATAVVAPLAASAASNALTRALPNGLKNAPGQLLSGSVPQGVPTSAVDNPNLSSVNQNPSFDNQPKMILEKNLQQPQQTQPLNNQIISQKPPANQVAANIPQPPDIQQPKGISDKLWDSIQDGKLTDKDPNVSAFMKVANNLRKTRGLSSKQDFDKLYQAFESKRQMGLQGPELARELFSEWDQMKEPNQEITEEKPKAIEKNTTVVSPNGVGEVKEIRNGKALIDVDGKLHKVREEELEGEPEDIADLYDNLFNAIPDEYKSRMMNYAGYDEESNELLFRPHGGAAYVYKDIPEEFATQLKNRLHKAKTTGKNMYGMWNEGDQSYGAGMSALIKELQGVYGGKGKEYSRKYNTLFDILGVPHEAKKRKEEENRRKRKGIS